MSVPSRDESLSFTLWIGLSWRVDRSLTHEGCAGSSSEMLSGKRETTSCLFWSRTGHSVCQPAINEDSALLGRLIAVAAAIEASAPSACVLLARPLAHHATSIHRCMFDITLSSAAVAMCGI